MSSKQKKDEEKRKKDQERELERIKKEEEKQEKLRQKEAERLKREEEKRKKEEEKEQERIKKEEEKRKKDEEREQERLKKEEERVKREEEKKKKEEEKEQEKQKREEERKKKEEEKEQQRLKKEEERIKKEVEKKQKQEEKDREKLKLEEKSKLQAEFLKSFLNKTPARKSTGSANNSLIEQNGGSPSIQNSPVVSPRKDASRNEDIEVIEISENDDGEVRSPKIPRLDFHPMPFQVKNGMALAPVLRRASLNIFEKHSVDKMVHPTKVAQILRADEDDLELMKKDSAAIEPSTRACESPVPMDTDDCALEPPEVMVGAVVVPPAVGTEGLPVQPYLEFLKKGYGRKSTRTEVKHFRDDNDDIEIIDPRELLLAKPKIPGQIRLRYKLLQFNENRRPPYWGTHRKLPLKVKPRRPFAQEEEIDYEFESDDEWEDEPEDGEELNSDKEVEDKEEEEKEVTEEVDEDMDEWMVPHGYLSDEEGAGDHYDKDTLKSREEEFYKEHKREHKLGLPVIETDDLSDYEIMFIPKRRCTRKGKVRKTATEFYETLDEIKKGNLTFEGALLSSDEEDGDWGEVEEGVDEAGEEADQSSSDSDDSQSSDDEASEDDLMVKKDPADLDPNQSSEEDADAEEEDEDGNKSMSSSASLSGSASSLHSEASEIENEDENMDIVPSGTESEILEESKCEGESEPGLTATA